MIHAIHDSAFIDCHRLSEISLEHNKLISFPADAFVHFSALKSLQLDKNRITNFTSLLEGICSTLESLENLEVDVFDEFVFPTTCNQLVNLTGIRLFVQTYIHMRGNTFCSLIDAPITNLHIQGESHSPHVYRPLDKNFLLPLSRLKTLHISFLSVSVSDIMGIILQPLENFTMDTINMNKFLGRNIVTLRFNELQYLQTICVKTLDLQWMRIQYVDFPSLRNSRLFHCLEELYLSSNFLVNFMETFLYAASFPRITVFDFCCQLLRKGVSPETCSVSNIEIPTNGMGSNAGDLYTSEIDEVETTYENQEYVYTSFDIMDFFFKKV